MDPLYFELLTTDYGDSNDKWEHKLNILWGDFGEELSAQKRTMSSIAPSHHQHHTLTTRAPGMSSRTGKLASKRKREGKERERERADLCWRTLTVGTVNVVVYVCVHVCWCVEGWLGGWLMLNFSWYSWIAQQWLMRGHNRATNNEK